MKETLGQKIRELREERNLTQEFVAKTLNMSCQKLTRIEKGQADISYGLILKLAEIFEVETNEITKIVQKRKKEMFRSDENSTSSFLEVENIVDMFFANMNLYNRMNVELNDEQ